MIMLLLLLHAGLCRGGLAVDGWFGGMMQVIIEISQLLISPHAVRIMAGVGPGPSRNQRVSRKVEKNRVR